MNFTPIDTTNYTSVAGTVHINVTGWKVTGFYSPVTMPTTGMPIWNLIKGGSTVPLKFNIYQSPGGPELTSTSAVANGSIAAYQVGCSDAPAVDETNILTNSGGTALRYDTTAMQFIQNWQTPKIPGVCYVAVMTAGDGTTLSSYFKTK